MKITKVTDTRNIGANGPAYLLQSQKRGLLKSPSYGEAALITYV